MLEYMARAYLSCSLEKVLLFEMGDIRYLFLIFFLF